jgi:hypothetical protein
MVAGKAQTHCPRLEGLVPWFFLTNRICLDTYELLNSSLLRATISFFYLLSKKDNRMKGYVI